MAARPKRLLYQGTVWPVRDEHGEVIDVKADRRFDGVPARDLDAEDIARLDDATLVNITGGPDPLYVEPAPDKKSGKDAE